MEVKWNPHFPPILSIFFSQGSKIRIPYVLRIVSERHLNVVPEHRKNLDLNLVYFHGFVLTFFSRLFGTGSALCEASCMRIWMEPNANPHHWNLMDYIQCCGVEIFFVRLSMRLHIWSLFWLHLQPYNFHLKLNYNSWTSLGGGRK